MHAIGGKKGLVVSFLVATIFFVVGFLSRGYCPLDKTANPWYRVLAHNLGFAAAIILLTSLLEVAGILLVGSAVGFAMFTCGRAVVCGSSSASFVALFEAVAYMLAYTIATVKGRWRAVLACIMFMLLLAASIIESGAA